MPCGKNVREEDTFHHDVTNSWQDLNGRPSIMEALLWWFAPDLGTTAPAYTNIKMLVNFPQTAHCWVLCYIYIYIYVDVLIFLFLCEYIFKSYDLIESNFKCYYTTRLYNVLKNISTKLQGLITCPHYKKKKENAH